MEDLLMFALGMAVCSSPFLALGYLVALLRKSRDGEARTRLDQVEAELAQLLQNDGALVREVKRLEAEQASLREALQRVQSARAASATAISEPTPGLAATAPREDLPSTAVAARGETPRPAVRAAEAIRVESELQAEAAAMAARADASSSDVHPAHVGEPLPAHVSAANAEPAAGVAAAPVAAEPIATNPDDVLSGADPVTSGAASATIGRAVGASAWPAPQSPHPTNSPTPPLPPLGAQRGAPPVPSPSEGSDEGWERWIGVRGAAVLGASVLVIAALYFFRFSVEHGWITPLARVLMGLLAGTACVVLSEWPLRARQLALPEGSRVPLGATLPNWLAGAGSAILYASSWAATSLYQLVPSWVSGVAMVAITAACAMLAVRRDAISMAVLGLLGGFLTPLALSTGQDRPISLFTYLLLLDTALLALAQRKRWPLLGLLALALTALYQLGWVFGRMGEQTAWIGVLVTLVFAALFVALPLLLPRQSAVEDNSLTDRVVRLGAVSVPFALTVSFALRQGVVVGWGATVGLLVACSIGAFFVARGDKHGWLLPAAASAASGVLWIFALTHAGAPAWQSAALALALMLTYLGLFELSSRWQARFAVEGAGLATLVVSAAASLALVLALALETDSEGLRGAVLLLCALGALRAVVRERWTFVAPIVALGHAMAASVLMLIGTETHREASWLPLAGVVTALVYQALATSTHRRGLAENGRYPSAFAQAVELSSAGAALLPLLALGAGRTCRRDHGALFVVELACFAIMLLLTTTRVASRRRPDAVLGVLALAAAALTTSIFAWSPAPSSGDSRFAWLRLGTSVGVLLLFALYPAYAPRLRETRWAWRTAALTPIALFPALHHGWTALFGASFIGALPVLLACVMLGIVLRARAAAHDEDRLSSVVWLAGAATFFITIAIPLQLDRSWITVGWALEAVALLALYTRLDHQGLKWVATMLFAFVCVRLLVNPYVLGYYERSPLRIFNWLSYTYLVPVACLAAGAWLLQRAERARGRTGELDVAPPLVAKSLLAVAYTSAALVILFAWLNLTIFDVFASGPFLTIPHDRMPARDLSISIAWAVYGLFLLALGMWRESTALRMTSLLIVLVTLGKVFVFDLSNLEDLYRVAALVGLAVSLLVISLAYQRFVFRKEAPAAPAITPLASPPGQEEPLHARPSVGDQEPS